MVSVGQSRAILGVLNSSYLTRVSARAQTVWLDVVSIPLQYWTVFSSVIASVACRSNLLLDCPHYHGVRDCRLINSEEGNTIFSRVSRGQGSLAHLESYAHLK